MEIGTHRSQFRPQPPRVLLLSVDHGYTERDQLSTGVTPVPNREDARIRSLAVMARALGRSDALLNLLEIAAEEARQALDASTSSVSQIVQGSMTIRTLLNVGK